MSEKHLDHPGDWHWFKRHGPAEVISPCPHYCDHRDQSVIAWGPDDNHYELVRCMTEPCGGQCRAWTDGSPDNTTPWMLVDVERVADHILAPMPPREAP